MKYLEMWKKLEVTQCNKYIAFYKVGSEPIKMKIRHLSPEYLQELNLQLDAILENGMIYKGQSE